MGVYIGTSGWSYDHWEDIVYPSGTKARERLDYYLKWFSTVELNSSFYHWPLDRVFASWAERLPSEFILTVKAPRNLTHFQRLYKPEYWMRRIEKSLGYLDGKLGVLLVQLPPSFDVDYPRLEYFLKIAPSILNMALEFRHPNWHIPETFQMLEHHEKAYCVMSGQNLPCVLKATTDFVYIRLHGPDDPSKGGSYSEDDLQWWSDRIREWEQMGKEVYAYFNNDFAGHAVRNAFRLRELVNIKGDR
jgi:uncharacterized protein YecE (DUF72 family)